MNMRKNNKKTIRLFDKTNNIFVLSNILFKDILSNIFNEYNNY